ncbi:ABC transporter substrate-binding protein [Microbacterium sp. B35-04]|uniref:extracellular solute-binding protein n=1 Tax=Microbacterium sp. B35-04 TaxID=1961716 RepID=UPI0013D7A421|nr:extracellular solute-binding protein [Microbacterium sp. B35-04]KAF2413636.1 ABC transporter substrate-binding protein [Microbacterium sp. B35-04]
MNHSKPLVGVGIAVVAALALTGCSGSSTGDDDATSTDAAKLESLSIMAPFLSTNAPEEENEIETALEDVIGVDLDMTWVPNASYGDKVNITLAGDDLPQVMVIQGKDPGFVRNAEAGAFWDLTEYLDDYENLKTTFPEVQRASSVNGKVYGIFRARDVMREAVIIRKDWLENVGLELPETTEDLYEIAKAFTEDDPDGNGADDTYGLIIPKWPGTIGTNSPWDAIETWYGAGTRWTERDDELVPNFTTDEWLEAVQFERQLVEEGVVNPDYATFDSAKWNEPFLTGKGGIIIDVHSRVGQLISLVKQSDPENFENFVDVTGNLTGPDGELYALPTSGYSGFLAVPKAQVRTEEELRGVLEVLNELNSAEAGPILNNGIEDVTYTLDGDLAVAVDDVPQALKDTVGAYAQLGMNVNGFQGYLPKQPSDYEQEMYDKRKQIEASDLESAQFDPAAPYVSPTYVSKGAQLDTIVADARIQYIAGQIDLDGLEDAIELWRSSGGDDIIAEINELANADS